MDEPGSGDHNHPVSHRPHRPDRHHRLRELTTLFLRLGATAFGGPAAHLSLMRHEVVERRGWVTDGEYARLVALANLVPGPSSTEVAMHVGRIRAGRRGLVVAGVAFLLPAFVMITALAWIYVRYGDLPRFRATLAGIAPVVVVLVVDAVARLARTSIRTFTHAALGAVAIGASFAGVHVLAILVAAGTVAWLVWRIPQGRTGGALGLLVVGAVPAFEAVGPALAVAGPVTLGPLFLVFVEIGSVLYGSGYVLFALLEQVLVHQHHWLGQQRLLDAISAGQVTPGPLFTTATFIGYTLRGFPGAVVATVGIFLPAFAFVALTDVVVTRLRDRPGFAVVLDGVVVASLGLMAAVAVVLGRHAFIDAGTVLIGVGAAGLLWWRRLNPVWLLLGAGAVGLAFVHLG